MRIVMAIHMPNTRTGGPARHMHYLQEEFEKRGHSMALLFSENIPVPLGKNSLSDLLFPAALALTLRKDARRYDLVNIHTLAAAGYVFLRRLFRKLSPCVVISHGGDELRWRLELEEARLGYRPLSWKTRFLYFNLIIRQARYATRYADHVITMSSMEKAFYIREYGMPPEKISVIPNGVSPEFFLPSRDYNRPPNRLLYLGGWEWRKGIRYLVEAFTSVARQHPNIVLSIAGVFEAPGILETFPEDLRTRIRVIPTIPAEKTPQLYADHDIFVLPTLFESIPLVIPEAMASGMPIVTTRVCGIPDILEHGKEAWLVPPRRGRALAEGISTLIEQPSLRLRLGRAAQEKAHSLTWDRIAHQTEGAYQKILDGPAA